MHGRHASEFAGQPPAPSQGRTSRTRSTRLFSCMTLTSFPRHTPPASVEEEFQPLPSRLVPSWPWRSCMGHGDNETGGHMASLEQLAPYWAKLGEEDRKHILLLAARFAKDVPGRKDEPDDGGGWLSVTQVAEWTGVSRSGIEHAIQRGALPATTPKGLKVGKRVRRNDVLAWMGGK